MLVVPEEYRAWTSGSAQDDARSITYEIVNSSASPDWRFSAETIDSVIKLDIDICRRYGITPKWGVPGLWQHRNLWEWFGRSYATACAGPSFPQAQIVSAVSAGLAGTAGSGATPIGREEIMARYIWAPGRGGLLITDTDGIFLPAVTDPALYAEFQQCQKDLYNGFDVSTRQWDVMRQDALDRHQATGKRVDNAVGAAVLAAFKQVVITPGQDIDEAELANALAEQLTARGVFDFNADELVKKILSSAGSALSSAVGDVEVTAA